MRNTTQVRYSVRESKSRWLALKLVDPWLRPNPARMAPLFTSADKVIPDHVAPLESEELAAAKRGPHDEHG